MTRDEWLDLFLKFLEIRLDDAPDADSRSLVEALIDEVKERRGAE